ncbi:hypothetical protein GLOIN_2v1484476 [Rhizophagus clarus]|uniref:hAT-like transposase RNase-H fold domain-containing protein n=1 Tax=Rhizophagus clarus TaxID=94130 RepID=A0A8H3LX14_9GLOM|nr:hypothetical protein GLOIN_2v1484476 [Rhizophagus clarus]
MLAAKHDSVCELMPDVEAWTKIKETVIILEPLERATKNLSGSLYPTIADVRFYFNEIRDHLKYCVEREDGFGQYMLAASINEKLKEYWLIIDNNTTISSILDPRNKISLFEPGEPTTNAIAALHEQFSFYLSQKPQSQASLPFTSSREYFRQLKKRCIGVTAETTLPPSPSPDFAEIERYLALPSLYGTLRTDTDTSQFNWLPLKDRDVSKIATIVKDNVINNWKAIFSHTYAKSDFSILVCGGAPGIGKTRFGDELFNSIETNGESLFRNITKFKNFEYIYLDFGNSIRLDEQDYPLKNEEIICLRILYEYFIMKKYNLNFSVFWDRVLPYIKILNIYPRCFWKYSK